MRTRVQILILCLALVSLSKASGAFVQDAYSTATGGVGALLSIFDTQSGIEAYPVYDGRGHVMGLVDAATGATLAVFDYGPYGEPFIEWSTTAQTDPRYAGVDLLDLCPFRYATKYTDKESQLVYYGYRYYDSNEGRWLSREPLGEIESSNLYQFVGNDPVNSYDYVGLDDRGYHQMESDFFSEIFEPFIEFFVGGRHYDDESPENDLLVATPRIRVAPREGRSGGVEFAIRDTLTLRLLSDQIRERHPTANSSAGMLFGSEMMPVITPALNLTYGTNILGQRADPAVEGLFLGVDLIPLYRPLATSGKVSLRHMKQGFLITGDALNARALSGQPIALGPIKLDAGLRFAYDPKLGRYAPRSGGTEKFYRIMSDGEYQKLVSNGGLSRRPKGSSELGITQDSDYLLGLAQRRGGSRKYSHLVEFEADAGTMQRLLDAGATHPSTSTLFPDLPVFRAGMTNPQIKLEKGGVMSVLLGGSGDAVDLFNGSLRGFKLVE